MRPRGEYGSARGAWALPPTPRQQRLGRLMRLSLMNRMTGTRSLPKAAFTKGESRKICCGAHCGDKARGSTRFLNKYVVAKP